MCCKPYEKSNLSGRIWQKGGFLFLLLFLINLNYALCQSSAKTRKKKEKKEKKSQIEPQQEVKKKEELTDLQTAEKAEKEETKPEPTEKTKEEARELASDLFFEGVILFDKGKYASALEKFSKSYELHPHWKTLYNMGMCYLEINDLPSAASKLSKFLEEGKEKIKKDLMEEVAQTLKTIKSKLGVLRLRGHYEGGKLTIDGAENIEGTEGKDIFITPGVHHIKLTRGSMVFVDRKITIEAGEEKEIFVVEKGVPEKESKTVVTPEDEKRIKNEIEKAERERKAKERKSNFKKTGWSFLGIALASLAAGGVTGIMALKGKEKVKDLEKEYKDNFELYTKDELDKIRSERNNEYNEAMTYSIISTVMFCAGGVSSLTSLIFLPLGYKKEKQNISFQINPDLKTLYLKVNF